MYIGSLIIWVRAPLPYHRYQSLPPSQIQYKGGVAADDILMPCLPPLHFYGYLINSSLFSTPSCFSAASSVVVLPIKKERFSVGER